LSRPGDHQRQRDTDRSVTVRRAEPSPQLARDLAEVLVDCVEGGASVGFMLPLELERAEAFWTANLDGAARGERTVLVAEDDGGRVLGTVQLAPAAAENQPHRGEISKLQVHRRARRRGAGEALMEAIESEARRAGLTLLTLDTSSDDADRLYSRLGWQRVGAIPRFALWPGGGFVQTTIFYKDLDAVTG
jgi:GNAT superfamily N-acetyltransferase